jgi:hypothetical protein
MISTILTKNIEFLSKTVKFLELLQLKSNKKSTQNKKKISLNIYKKAFLALTNSKIKISSKFKKRL